MKVSMCSFGAATRKPTLLYVNHRRFQDFVVLQVSTLQKHFMYIPWQELQVVSSRNAPDPEAFKKVRKDIVKCHTDASLFLYNSLNLLQTLNPADLILQLEPRLEASSARRASRALSSPHSASAASAPCKSWVLIVFGWKPRTYTEAFARALLDAWSLPCHEVTTEPCCKQLSHISEGTSSLFEDRFYVVWMVRVKSLVKPR